MAATRGAVVYFVIAELSKIDPMYEYSLQYIKRVFNAGLTRSVPQETPGERIRELVCTVTELLFTTVSRGLFERHKILFAFMLITSIYRLETPVDFGAIYRREHAALMEERRRQEELKEAAK